MDQSATRTRYHEAIVNFFDGCGPKILRLADIADLLAENRELWKAPASMTTSRLIRVLTRHGSLKRWSFPFPHRKELRYTWGDVPLLEVLLALKPNAYFTHHTAMRIHRLTEAVPNTIYVNHEQAGHSGDAELQQERIDLAFQRAPRQTKNVVQHEGRRICLLNGMYTNQLGVIEKRVPYDSDRSVRARFTNLERTLIDITVRPVYAGGVVEVFNAYCVARERVSVKRLVTTLQTLGYAYPYHQAIGFYLERAGHRPSSLDPLRKLPQEFDFYLAHKMGRTCYTKEWRLHVPREFPEKADAVLDVRQR